MKSVLISIKPYWVFLIIAKTMGWSIDKEKTVEVRKNYPKDLNWDKVAKIYCSKDKKSFAKIPKEYQRFMERLLGKVIGEFVCERIDRIAHCGTCNRDIRLNIVDKNLYCKELNYEYLNKCKLSYCDIEEYSNGGDVYGWHISDLVIYEKPRELREFFTIKCTNKKSSCFKCGIKPDCIKPITKPPQSWCYVEKG